MRYVLRLESTRGPKTLTDLEGDFVHAVGIMHGAYRMAAGGLPDILKRIRRVRGWSQRELADVMGCTKQAISYVESGVKKPGPEMLGKVRAFLTEGKVITHDQGPRDDQDG